VWQNTVRSGVAGMEITRRDFVEEPAQFYASQADFASNHHTFENDAVPEEFLYFLSSQIDSAKTFQDIKVLPPVWEVGAIEGAWRASGEYTGSFSRLDGVDCYQVVYTRSDGASAEYYVSRQGRQVMAFKTFRGTWFKRVQ
jgi:hypothetical protein